MIYYKLKVMHDEYYKLNFSPTRHNRKAYPKEENNLGDDSSMFLAGYGNLCDTIIAANIYLVRNNILQSIFLILSYLRIGGAKYRIYSQKTETATNITVHKITERLEYNTILEGNSDEGKIHLLLTLKYIVTVVDTVSIIINTPYSMILVFCETNVRYYQYNIKADIDHYL